MTFRFDFRFELAELVVAPIWGRVDPVDLCADVHREPSAPANATFLLGVAAKEPGNRFLDFGDEKKDAQNKRAHAHGHEHKSRDRVVGEQFPEGGEVLP
ncbi:MAG TPA: hypothetical protein VF345_14255 [Chthoniobacterales bacterium]